MTRLTMWVLCGLGIGLELGSDFLPEDCTQANLIHLICLLLLVVTVFCMIRPKRIVPLTIKPPIISHHEQVYTPAPTIQHDTIQ